MSHYKASSIEAVLGTIRHVSRWPRTTEESLVSLGISRATFMRHLAVARDVYGMRIELDDGHYYVRDFGIFDAGRLVYLPSGR